MPNELYNAIKSLLENLAKGEKMPEDVHETFTAIYKLSKDFNENRNSMNQSLKVSTTPRRAKIGILYGKKQGNKFFHLLNILKNFSEKYQVNIACFSVDDIDLEKELVKGIFITGQSAENTSFQLPYYIYNLALHSRAKSIKIIRQLRTSPDIKLINPVNRFNQAIIFDILSSFAQSEKFLLPYTMLTPSIVADYLLKYGSILLMPERGLAKAEAIFIEKSPKGKKNTYVINTGGVKSYCKKEVIFPSLKKIIQDQKYFVMQGIDVVQWNELPLEIRAYVQKDKDKWVVTECIAKNEFFSSGSIFNNTSEICSRVVNELFPERGEKIQKKITNCAINACTYLNHYISDLGSCYIDFILNQKGEPYIIYFGGWEQKDFLFNINGRESWNKYLRNCLEYMIYLEKSKKG